MDNMTKHRMKWFVYAGREKIRHTGTMRGEWGYDVECSCGWQTHTGGAVKSYILNEVYFHKLFEGGFMNKPPTHCAVCGRPIWWRRGVNTARKSWQHMRPSPTGAPHDHPAQPKETSE